MIQATNIVKRFGDLEVLRGVNLTVKSGEIVSIVGASVQAKPPSSNSGHLGRARLG